MSTETIKLPDIGVSDAVEIIEISVKAGDEVNAEDTLLVLESDKASMDIPAPHAGRIGKVLVSEGDKVSTGDPIIEMITEGGSEAPAAETAPQQTAPEAVAAPQQDVAQPAQSTTRIVDIHVPDLSGSDDVPIIELAVSEGDTVDAEDSLITLESDKASMDVPSPYVGRIVSLAVKEGDHVSTGDLIGQMEITEQGAPAATEAPAQAAPAPQQVAPSQPEAAPAASAEPQRREIRVPDIGGSENVPVIEVAISVGDEISKEDTLITLESDKASMDVPSPFAGKVVEVAVKEGDTLSEGDLIGYIKTAGEAPKPAAQPAQAASSAAAPQQVAPVKAAPTEPSTEALTAEERDTSSRVHAGPAVRMLARELGVDLTQVKGSGPKARVLKEDVHTFVKQRLNQPAAASKAAATGGAGIPQVPAIDFSKFGEIDVKPMGRLLQAGANNLHRSWLNVPHVTQFDDADITELEAFRKSMKDEAAAQGARLTPLPFMIKACAYALRKFPQFNVSLHPDGDKLIWKNYVHIGIAVDTPDGLMVPVLRNADQKSVIQIAIEMADLAKRAQDKKLTRDEMTGGCFTISSLGSIGGTAFTPIVNTPEVAILGISKAQMKPVWDGQTFQPRLMLPLCLSYDHRALNGADGARFTTYLAQLLSDIRRLLM
ncbi:dihydrolipoyllysine-residue acetyltransferase [Zymobacter sp. IVIA_5232.4 C2]|uniref:dihydrolipoyllysine-residue acetyltransferase n=1 Tax=Zymobacter sp. IVIA_5232.4 C2 TaxID=3394855 RepID=UPI0039C02066